VQKLVSRRAGIVGDMLTRNHLPSGNQKRF
jgi:hypothetical protein